MFHGLKLYTVHTKSGTGHTLEKPIFLREGFNWMAFIFTFIWAFSKRLWLFGFVMLAANFAVAMLSEGGYIAPLSAGVIQFAIQFFAGFHGNDCLRKKMARQGYIFQDITSGDSLLRAEQRYFDRLTAKA